MVNFRINNSKTSQLGRLQFSRIKAGLWRTYIPPHRYFSGFWSLVLVIALATSLAPEASGQFFNQDFRASATAGDYINATPNARQFSSVNKTGQADYAIATTGGNNFLRFTRGNNGSALLNRFTDIVGSGSINAAIIRFTIVEMTGTDASNEETMDVQLGTEFVRNSAPENDGDLFGQFYIHHSDTEGQFRVATLLR